MVTKQPIAKTGRSSYINHYQTKIPLKKMKLTSISTLHFSSDMINTKVNGGENETGNTDDEARRRQIRKLKYIRRS